MLEYLLAPIVLDRFAHASHNAIVLGLANDFSAEPKYLDAIAEGMNYILGRNPLDKSFVTGYGKRPLEHPHHRFWAHQASAKFPSAPPGIVCRWGEGDDAIWRGAGARVCALGGRL